MVNNRKAKIAYLKAIESGKPITLFNTPSVVITSGDRAYIDSIGVFPLNQISRFVDNCKTIFMLPDNGREEIFQ